MTQIKPFGFKRNLDYFKENFFIMIKVMTEYKVNLIVGIIQMFVFIFIHLLGLYLISYSFGDLIGWEFIDFILFYFLTLTSFSIAGLFIWNKRLNQYLLSGLLNRYLVIPMDTRVGYIFSNLSGWALLTFILRGSIFTIILVSFFNISFFKIAVIFILILLINLLYFTIIELFEATEFFMKGSSYIINSIYESIFSLTSNYPANFFNKFQFKEILFIVPPFIASYLVIPLVKNQIALFQVFKITSIIIILSITFLSLTLIMWHYGLKKYEAFG